MKHNELHQFMDLLLDYGWHIENAHSSELLYFVKGEMVWELTNDNYLKTNTLTFFCDRCNRTIWNTSKRYYFCNR